jgi:hypothetical protein
MARHKESGLQILMDMMDEFEVFGEIDCGA